MAECRELPKRHQRKFSHTFLHSRTNSQRHSQHFFVSPLRSPPISLFDPTCLRSPLCCSSHRPAVPWAALLEKTTRMWSGNTQRTAAMAKMKTRLSCQSWWCCQLAVQKKFSRKFTHCPLFTPAENINTHIRILFCWSQLSMRCNILSEAETAKWQQTASVTVMSLLCIPNICTYLAIKFYLLMLHN